MKTIKAHPTYGKKLRLAAFVVGVAVTLLAMSSYSPVLAQADTQNSIVNNADHSDRRFYVAGDRIVFQGAVPREDNDSIDMPDAIEFRELARQYPEIRLIEIDSLGGYVPGALAFAHLISDLGFDTTVSASCESACTYLFMAGRTRTLEAGGKLGFHGLWWGRESIKEFYSDSREENGWLDEMAFASWAYEEGMRDQRLVIDFALRHQISIEFILRASEVYAGSMWYPTRAEMLEANVISSQHLS